jgi:hypothetical protein
MESVRSSRSVFGFLALLASVAVPLGVLEGCVSGGDPPAQVTPSPVGTGSHIKDVVDPTRPGHLATASATISGATYLWTDTYDETGTGKSLGSIYVQDMLSTDPYSGASIFEGTYIPEDLQPVAGDVLDITGTYSESTSVGKAIFTAPDVLPQFAKPTIVSRFEYVPPTPRVIDPTDLNDYNKGRQWLGMLVTITNVTFGSNVGDDGNGRDSAKITPDTSTTGATVTNEFFNLAAWNNGAGGGIIAKGQKVKSITGIVTWFFNYHVVPRSPGDIVVQ